MMEHVKYRTGLKCTDELGVNLLISFEQGLQTSMSIKAIWRDLADVVFGFAGKCHDFLPLEVETGRGVFRLPCGKALPHTMLVEKRAGLARGGARPTSIADQAARLL
jgi:hypothetical protein